MANDDLMMADQAAERLHVTAKTVQSYCRRGLLPGARKSAGIWIIPGSAIDAFFAWITTGQPSGDLPTPPPPPPDASPATPEQPVFACRR